MASILRKHRWTLDDATLSNGATIQAAGSGLPRRIEPELLVVPFTGGTSVHNGQVGIAFRPDGGFYALTGVNRIDRFSAAGASLANVTSSTVSGLTPSGMFYDSAADELFVGNYTTGGTYLHSVIVLDGATLAYKRHWRVTVTGSDAGYPAEMCGSTAAGRLWVIARGLTRIKGYAFDGTEFVDIDLSASGLNVWGLYGGKAIACSLDGSRLFFLGMTYCYELEPDAAVIVRTVSSSWATTEFADRPDATHVRIDLGAGMDYDDAADEVLVLDSRGQESQQCGPMVVRSDATTPANWEQVALGLGPRGFGAWQGINTAGQILRIDKVSGLDRVAVVQNNPNLATDPDRSGWRIHRRGAQRARFSRTFTRAATVIGIGVPGWIASHKSATLDDVFRKARFYYSTDGGGSRTEFTPGDELAVAVAAGAALTVDVDFVTFAGVAGWLPFVGGDAGAGPIVLYDEVVDGPDAADPQADVRAFLVAAGVSSPALTGDDVYEGREIPSSTQDGAGSVPDRAVFVIDAGGAEPSRHHDGTALHAAMVIVTVRSAKDAFESGANLAADVWAALDGATLSADYVDGGCEALQDRFEYSGTDEAGRHLWRCSFRCRFVA